MDGATFDTYVRTQLAPSPAPGDVVILDNLNVHKSPRARYLTVNCPIRPSSSWFTM